MPLSARAGRASATVTLRTNPGKNLRSGQFSKEGRCLMKHLVPVVSVMAAVLFAGGVCAAQTTTGGGHPPPAAPALERMPKDLEVRFALSALPPHLRDAATVYVLDPKTGYVLDRKGINGFSCIVERTEWARESFSTTSTPRSVTTRKGPGIICASTWTRPR